MATGRIVRAHSAVKMAGAGRIPPPAKCPPAAKPRMIEPIRPVRKTRKGADVVIGGPFRFERYGGESLKFYCATNSGIAGEPWLPGYSIRAWR
ncbi:hypothetical protein GCM10017710_32340 [Arthrobacter ramosus]